MPQLCAGNTGKPCQFFTVGLPALRGERQVSVCATGGEVSIRMRVLLGRAPGVPSGLLPSEELDYVLEMCDA